MLPGFWSDAQHAQFVESRRAKQPFAAPSVIGAPRALLDWARLARVLAVDPAPDALVIRRGEPLPEPLPSTEEAIRALFRNQAGVVVRRAERHDPDLAALAESYERAFGESAHLQLFATPAGTHGFGWHYDAEDVCILQTDGIKTYYFRENTRGPCLDPGARPDFTEIRRETSPTMTCTLAAGDALYLPRGMWHVARAKADALSISVGLR